MVVLSSKFRLEESSYREVEVYLRSSRIVIVPVGSFEAHGSHLPLSTDTLIAESIAELAAKKLNDRGVKVMVGPTIPLGCSGEHLHFPGTLSLSPEIMINLIYQVCLSLHRSGFKHIILLNGHGGNEAPLKAAAVKLRDELGLIVAIINWFELISEGKTDHAGPIETSIILSYKPKLVNEHWKLPSNKARRGYISFKQPAQIPLPDMWNHTDGLGYLGNPASASAERGESLIEEASDRLVSYILRVKSKGFLFGRIF